MNTKKRILIPSLAIAVVLVAGSIGVTSASGDHSNDGMMNGMMNGEGMNQMMEAMDSPEGQAMMDACHNFMVSNEEETTE